MISVLLPAYDCDLSGIVRSLHGELMRMDVSFEIISYDDDPDSHAFEQNQSLSSLAHVTIARNQTNLGRSANRNALALASKYDWLLFIDGDSDIIHTDYIQRYLDHIEHYSWIYGGTKYPEQAPPGCGLHHKYGTEMEALKIEDRHDAGALAFRSNNFLLRRSIFMDHMFDEELIRYGHEDTLLAQSLTSAAVAIHHIDNPVLHTGLYEDAQFLERVEESIRHLAELELSGKLQDFTRLQQIHVMTDMPALRGLRNTYLRWKRRSWRKQALKKHDLRALAFYKWSVYSAELS